MTRAQRLGVMFRREWAPERLADVARRVEHNGFDELWVVEDLGYHGGFTQAATALAVTTDLHVGLGIAPAAARNVAYAAMEIATLGRLFPGRFHMGFGHGVAHWMAEVGATPVSWIASIDEVTRAAIQLLDGERVDFAGRHVHLDGVSLIHPPTMRPPISLGVIGPRSIDVVRSTADGVVLCEGSGPRFVADVRERIGDDRTITVFVDAGADADGIRTTVDERLAHRDTDARFAPYVGMTDDDVRAEVALGGPPDSWLDQLDGWFAAGADSVVLTALSTDPADVVDAWVLP